MCGICGVMHGDRERSADIALVERMNRALEHRGPDDTGLWSKGHAALAMRRLSVIDLFRGRQPMSNQDQSVVLVYNGEIYNFQELRDFLETRGHVFHTLSDTEVVLRAYEEFGDDALHHLNGMFAFALYDARKDRLLLARDRIGIKPL
ncbi:MAG: asparagine synthetase B, partial [Candidatus Hydrogenedentes bacterium]|nr:asparagine synthetase B [Candidatus Hydrogenedentota bacterium]